MTPPWCLGGLADELAEGLAAIEDALRVEATLARDLDQFESVMVRADVVAGFRQVRAVPVIDRIGHRVGAVAMWPL